MNNKLRTLSSQLTTKVIVLAITLLVMTNLISIAVAGNIQETPSSSPVVQASAVESLKPSPVTSAPTIGTTPKATETTSQQGEASGMQMPVATSSKDGVRTYSSVHVDGPYIAMTFDDGPSAALTPRLLDILKERGIKVTFFMIGENAQQYPEIVARVAAEGHEIGNHSWSHPSLPKLSDEGVREQLNKTSEAIAQATGKRPTLLRPPYGAVNPRLTRLIEQQYGMKVIMWSVDPNDWKRPGAAIVSQRILAGARPGSIVLSHDIHPGTIEAMPATLDALKAKGYHFVTVSELIAMESKNSPTPTPTPASSKAPSRKK